MRSIVLCMVVVLVLVSVSGICVAEVDKKGAAPGKWTMDFDAARKVASAKKLPILLNFSGSDWCGWCKLMEENVFSKKEWKDYAKDNMLMVVLDFPRDKTIVPANYARRNDEFKNRYKVEGFPTFILLDDDAETVLGRLSAGRDKTPESFKGEVAPLVRYRAAETAKYAKTLKPKQKAEYLKIVGQMTECRTGIKDQKKQAAAAEKKIEELEEKLVKIEESATEFRVARMGADELKKYKKLTTELKAAEKELADWIGSGPQRTPENTLKFQAMSAKIEELKGKAGKY